MAIPTRLIRALPVALVLLLSAAALPLPPHEDLVVQGVVNDDRTGRPLEAAQVWVEGTMHGALTDPQGRYRLDIPLDELPPDPVIVAQLIGYHAERTTLEIPAGASDRSVTANFRLHEQALSLETLVVTGSPTTGDSRSRPSARRHHVPDARPGREQYARIVENGFRSVRDHPLSTFSTDVDRASYSNIRRFLLRERRLPPVDAVQVEEMINYFSYDYAPPEGTDPVAITTEVGQAPWAPAHRLLRIGLATRSIVAEEMPANNLVFLIDVSGSMQSYDKLPLVKRSLRLLVDQLRPRDRVAIVVYAGSAGLVLESTSGRHKDEILEAIDRLEAGGSTAGGAGLRLAYRVAREHFHRGGNNRVILATDGDFNVGESSDAAMVRLIEDRREEGTFLTVLGFGTGNLQSEKMQSIAQHGNGNYAYIDGLAEARKMLVHEIGGTLVTVAKDVKVQVEFNPAHVAGYRLIGYENRLLADEDFNDDTKDAGDLGSGHRVTALYEILPTGSDTDLAVPGIDPLRYQAPAAAPSREMDDEIAFVRIRYKQPDGDESRLLEQPVNRGSGRVSADFNFAAAVASFGMLLRTSEYRGTTSVHQILALASEGMGADLDGYRRGFVEMVERYRELSTHTGPLR